MSRECDLNERTEIRTRSFVRELCTGLVQENGVFLPIVMRHGHTHQRNAFFDAETSLKRSEALVFTLEKFTLIVAVLMLIGSQPNVFCKWPSAISYDG